MIYVMVADFFSGDLKFLREDILAGEAARPWGSDHDRLVKPGTRNVRQGWLLSISVIEIVMKFVDEAVHLINANGPAG